MLRVEALPARMGDCLVIEYGTAAQRHYVVIDGGTARTADNLVARLGALGAVEIELLVVSHIDNDHIAGVLDFLERPELPLPVGEVWFNGFRHLPESPVESLGPVQGERLTTRLTEPDLRDRWNAAFGGRAVGASPDGPLPIKTLPGGMEVTVLAPGPAALAALRPIWKDIVKEGNLDPQALKDEVIDLPPNIEQLGAFVPPDVPVLAAEEFEAEAKPANGSSIVLLAEFDDKKLLLTGDGQPAMIVPAIDRLVGSGNTLEVDLFQSPHHGSKGNLNVDLASRVRAPNILFSSNGPKGYQHPNREAVARILLHGGPQPKKLHFNYRHMYNDPWDHDGAADLRATYNYQALYPAVGEDGIAIDGL